MKDLFLLSEDEKTRILKLHINSIKNEHSPKRVVSEGKAQVVKNAIAQCASTDKNQNRNVDDNYIGVVIKEFEDAYGDFFTGTDLDSYRNGISMIKQNFTFPDFCRFVELYEEKVGENFYEATDSDIDYESEWTELVDGIDATKKRYSDSYLEQQKNQQQQQNQQLQTSPAGQGWTWDKVNDKFPCLSAADVFDKNPKQSVNGDYMRANLDGVEGVFYIQDGHLYVGNKDMGYYACNGQKLSRVADPYREKTNQATGGPMNESYTKKKELIYETWDQEVIDRAKGNEKPDKDKEKPDKDKEKPKKEKKSSTGTKQDNYLSRMQNKIAELDPTYKPTGVMDQVTKNKIMELLTKGAPTQTQFQNNLNQVSTEKPIVNTSLSKTIE